MRIRVYNPRETYRPNSDYVIKNLFASFERDFNDRWRQFDKLFEELNRTIKEQPDENVRVIHRTWQPTEIAVKQELNDIRRQIEEIKAVIIPKRFMIKSNPTKTKLTVISSI